MHDNVLDGTRHAKFCSDWFGVLHHYVTNVLRAGQYLLSKIALHGVLPLIDNYGSNIAKPT